MQLRRIILYVDAFKFEEDYRTPQYLYGFIFTLFIVRDLNFIEHFTKIRIIIFNAFCGYTVFYIVFYFTVTRS